MARPFYWQAPGRESERNIFFLKMERERLVSLAHVAVRADELR